MHALGIDPEIGYTQGMNFIAAIILMHVPNEVLACHIFMKVLAKDSWTQMYTESTPKLFEVSQAIQDRLQDEDAELYDHLFEHQILLEQVLAGPIMTLFANTTNFSVSTHILNMFILDGEEYIVSLILGIYKSMRTQIMALKDQFDVMAYLSKTVFVEALDQGKFYKQASDNS